MSNYKSITEVDMTGGSPYAEIGHTIGLAAILTRLVEGIAGPDRDRIAEISSEMMRQCFHDIDRKSHPDISSEQEAVVKEQAKAAVRQVLEPLTELGTVQ